jgi:hypothetical protein
VSVRKTYLLVHMIDVCNDIPSDVYLLDAMLVCLTDEEAAEIKKQVGPFIGGPPDPDSDEGNHHTQLLEWQPTLQVGKAAVQEFLKKTENSNCSSLTGTVNKGKGRRP